MALNGSDLINEPWNTSLQPFHQLWEEVTGHPETLWVYIFVMLTFAVFMTTERNGMATSIFMITAGSIMTTGNIFVGSGPMTIIFTIFTGIGFASMFISLYLQRR